MDEWSSITENEPEIVDCKHCVPDFTNIDTLLSNSCVNRTNGLNGKTLNGSSEMSSKTMESTGTERFFNKPLNVNIRKNNTSNRENTDVKTPVTAMHLDKHFTESPNLEDMPAYEVNNVEVVNKNLSPNKSTTHISEFCHSHLQYLGYSLLHELLMML